MCPDREILSVYLDGELPSPWKEKMESHLALCARCRERLEGYRVVHDTVFRSMASPGAMEAARERVWANLERRRGTGSCLYRDAGIWRRRVTVPLPAAAAAAAIFVIVLALVWIRRPAAYLREPEAAMAAEIDMGDIVPMSDLNGVLQYLGGEDTGNYVILKLPESRSFMSMGEPTILKEADYRVSQYGSSWGKTSR